MIRGIARTAARQRLGSRSALGLMPSSLSRRQLHSIRNILAPVLASVSRRPLFPAFLSLPVVVERAVAEEIEVLPSLAAQIPAVPTDPVVALHTVSEVLSTHMFPVRGMLTALETLHTSLGVSWAETIIALTFAIRLCLVPVLIHASKTSAKTSLMRPELEAINAEAKRKQALNMDAREVSSQQAVDTMALYRKHGINPFAPLAMPLVAMPLFGSMFFAIQALCTEGIIGMNTEGLLWFQDLTARDPYFILPVFSSVTGALILKRGSEFGGVMDPKVAPFMKLFIALGLASPIFTHMFPSGLLVYFSAMSFFSLIQGEIIRSDGPRKLLGIPTLGELRIRKEVPGGYTSFESLKQEQPAGGSIPQSIQDKTEEGEKKTARKRPLPMPKRR